MEKQKIPRQKISLTNKKKSRLERFPHRKLTIKRGGIDFDITQVNGKYIMTERDTQKKTEVEIVEKLSKQSSEIEQNNIGLFNQDEPTQEPSTQEPSTQDKSIHKMYIKTDMSKYVPKLSSSDDTYISRKFGGQKDMNIIEKAYSATPKYFCLFEGETGTGKTLLVRNFCAKKKIPYARVNLSGGTTPDELIGRWVPTEEGKFRWQDGTLTEFVRNGGVFVADEYNACPPEISLALNGLTDHERCLRLNDKDGELIYAHPDFFFVATINPASDYDGRNKLDETIKDRFAVKLFFDYDDKIEEKLIDNKDIRNLAKQLRKSEQVNTPVSTRTLVQFCKNIDVFGDKLAFEMFLNGFDSDERKPIENVFEMVTKNWDPSLDDVGDSEEKDEL